MENRIFIKNVKHEEIGLWTFKDPYDMTIDEKWGTILACVNAYAPDIAEEWKEQFMDEPGLYWIIGIMRDMSDCGLYSDEELDDFFHMTDIVLDSIPYDVYMNVELNRIKYKDTFEDAFSAQMDALKM